MPLKLKVMSNSFPVRRINRDLGLLAEIMEDNLDNSEKPIAPVHVGETEKKEFV
jgi:hypothetical protein